MVSLFHIGLALLAWGCIGVAVLGVGMNHIRAHAAMSNAYARMAIEDASRTLAMRMAQAAIVIGWPIAVAYAVLQSIRDQSLAAHYSLQ